ncbi:DUF4331 domain-containing protein [Rhizobium sp. TRM95796]|uniref:DUF4331 domain-containing protein n=1 Tax=Rhizobium sp. TRM95796 TaxID=2979862 RepID=UPI0021E94002|nr:DUF4331 domain-containing protein [Rhizobium sp. TRM95796]MCV3768606.1 DUF4331 domain-containing protein [Rhizobium sp. TRM95796]
MAPNSRLALLLVLLLWLGVSTTNTIASDHADPTRLLAPESNITDLFLFPDGDRMTLIFNVRRALLNPPPYNLASFVYRVDFDLKTPVSFEDAANRARYGGTVLTTDSIAPTASVVLRLKNDATIDKVEFPGFTAPETIRYEAMVRDDPFNFPRFYKRNAVTMVLSIPRAAFPGNPSDFILWGGTYRNGEKIDHVGRSIRTQLPRFGFLNTLEPKAQKAALEDRKGTLDDIYNFLRGNREWWSQALAEFMEFTVLLRKYDVEPDVMIYSDRFPVGYPNGRLLTDDVVAQTCAFGDCLLQELSFIEGDFPRSTTNDKPFLSVWPYEAPPWPSAKETPPTGSIWPYAIGLLVAIGLVFWLIGEALRFLIKRLWRLWTRFVISAH